MHILYLDLCFFSGHKHLNLEQVKTLDKLCDLTLIAEADYYPPGFVETLERTELHEFKRNSFRIKNRVTFRLKSLMNILCALKRIKNRAYDKIFIASFETMTFSVFSSLFCRQAPVFIFHHQNTDELSTALKRLFFKPVIKKVHHVVLDEFIRAYLLDEFGLEESHVHTLPHPIRKSDLLLSQQDPSIAIKRIVAISGSNDHQAIGQLIDDYQRHFVKIDPQTQLIVKSKIRRFQDSHLIVVNRYLSVQDYEVYYRDAHLIWLPFPPDYRYRLSGTLIDALSMNKVVVGPSTPCFQTYHRRYPSLVRLADDFDTVLEISRALTADSISESDSRAFHMAHSPEQMRMAFTHILSR